MVYSFWREGLLIGAVALAVFYAAVGAFKRGDRSTGRWRLAIAIAILLLAVLIGVTSIGFPG